MKTKNAFLLIGIFLVAGRLCSQTPAGIASDNGDGWSKPDNNLRGRLSVLPPKDSDTRRARIFIEFQNLSFGMGSMEIRFETKKLILHVTDKEGHEVQPVRQGSWDGMQPLWTPIQLPYEGTIKFLATFPIYAYDPQKDEVIVEGDSKADQTWTLPNTGEYFLSGTFSVSPEGEHSPLNWHGTLVFPKVAIPKIQKPH